jgi:hypothetical protein
MNMHVVVFFLYLALSDSEVEGIEEEREQLVVHSVEVLSAQTGNVLTHQAQQAAYTLLHTHNKMFKVCKAICGNNFLLLYFQSSRYSMISDAIFSFQIL